MNAAKTRQASHQVNHHTLEQLMERKKAKHKDIHLSFINLRRAYEPTDFRTMESNAQTGVIERTNRGHKRCTKKMKFEE